MAVGEEEELEHFEQDAECAGAHGGSKRSWQFTVGSFQTEGTEDKSAYARSGSHLLADTARQASVTRKQATKVRLRPAKSGLPKFA